MTLKFKVGQEIICTSPEAGNDRILNNPGTILAIVPTARFPYLVEFTKPFTGSHHNGPIKWWCSGKYFQLYTPIPPQEKIKNKINYLWNKQNYIKTLKHV